MLSSDLAASQRRLQDRAKAHSERMKQKAEKERILAERQKARQTALEEQRRQRRLDELLAQEQERAKHEADLERNNGVYYRAKLRAVPAPESIASEKGIKRAADKVLLPPSAGASLMNQDAYKNGALFFELSNGSGRVTHASVLEFTAAEGFIALPLKCIKCLWGPNATAENCEGVVDVVYRKLPKGTKVVFQPRSASFQESIGDDIRSVLEAALLQHSALTEKDWITVVDNAQQPWDLRVRELYPETAVSVIDTDLEAEINPSIETEDRIKAEEEEAQRRLEEMARVALEHAALLREEELQKVQAAEQAERDRLAKLALQQEKAANLPPEPDAQCPDAVTVMFRFPDGQRHSRRFMPNDPLLVVFDFVQSKGASGMLPGEFALVTSFPRRVFEYPSGDGSITVANSGLGGGGSGNREVLFLEPVAAAAVNT